MKKILIINAHQLYEGMAEGKLTKTFINKAKDFFLENNFEVKYTCIDKGYDIEEELEKISWADSIFFQYPTYWMSVPWLAKKYLDEVFTAGKGSITYINDGRSRDDSSKKYGSGGLMTEKNYMLSLTYSCPSSEFDNKNGFYDGLSLDQVNFSIHKIFQFCGAKQLDSYAIFDVYKSDLDLIGELNKFKKILEKNFKG